MYLCLQKPIQSLIPLIQRIRYKGVEIEFSERLAEVAAEVGKSPLLVSGESEDIDQIYTLADISPAAAVVEAWKRIELAAKDKVLQLLPEGETYKNPLRRPIDYLDYKGALVPSAANAG